jgi:hypothetical protein
MGEGRGVYRNLVEKPEGKRLLGRPRCRWEHNIKMDLHKRDVGVWTGLSWFRIQTGGWHLQMRKEIPSYKNAWNFMTSCKPVSF